MKRRRAGARSTAPSGWGARALKWVGGITAIISLVLGAQQLSTWIGDSLQRRREAATQTDLARQQASRGDFAEAWKSLERADSLQPGDAVDSARIEIAFAWLEDSRPGPGRPFSTITDTVTPALDRALLNASGRRRADLLAHLGWAEFLRARDGARGDPEARYRDALAVDAGNAYANAMLGHWLMWRGATAEAARERFVAALSDAGDRRPFVRRLQLAALANRGDSADIELLRVADEMRQRNEELEPSVADSVYRVFLFRFRPGVSRADDVATPSANLEATYEWVVKTSPAAARSGEVDAIRQSLKRPRP